MAAGNQPRKSVGFSFDIGQPVQNRDKGSSEGSATNELNSSYTGLNYSSPANADADEDSFSFAGVKKGFEPFKSKGSMKRGRRNPSESSGDEPGLGGKKRVLGGRAPVPKKVTVDLDSDDELIKNLKDAGYRDEAVRDRLIEEGRVRYDPKTIATRYRRILACLAEYEEKVLDEDFSDYRVGEDEHLLDAYAKCLDEYKKEQQDVEDRFWKNVAIDMKKTMQRAKYTKTQCRIRYESIADGTSIAPLELDENPQRREEQILERKEQLRQRKEAEREEEIRKALEKEQKQKAKQAELDAKANKKIAVRKDKEADQERIKRFIEQQRRDRADFERRKAAARAHRDAGGNQSQTDIPPAVNPANVERVNEARGERGRRQEHLKTTKNKNADATNSTLANARSTATTNHTRTPSNSNNAHPPPSSGETEVKDESTATANNPTTTNASTAQTLTSDPRETLSEAALANLLHLRNLPTANGRLQALQRIRRFDEELTNEKLREILRGQNLHAWGTRAILLERLAQHDVETAGALGRLEGAVSR